LIDLLKLHLHELRLPAEAFRDLVGHLDVEAAHDGRIARIGFNIRRAAFGISTPVKDRQENDEREHARMITFSLFR